MKQTIRDTQGRAYEVELYHNGYVWVATEENYDGPEDKYRIATGLTKNEALSDLCDRLEEHSDKWLKPNQIDFDKEKEYFFNYRGMVFSYFGRDINDVERKIYADIKSMTVVNHIKLISINKN